MKNQVFVFAVNALQKFFSIFQIYFPVSLTGLRFKFSIISNLLVDCSWHRYNCWKKSRICSVALTSVHILKNYVTLKHSWWWLSGRGEESAVDQQITGRDNLRNNWEQRKKYAELTILLRYKGWHFRPTSVRSE